MATREPRTDAKQRLVDGARTLFAEQGYSTTSIRDIGRACGINSATLYSHFPSKAELFVAVVGPYLDAAQAAFADAAVTPGTGAHRLEAMIDATLEVQHRYRDEYLSLLRDWHNIARLPELDALLARRRHGSELWLRVIADAIADGSLRSDVRPAEVQWLVVNLGAAVFDDRFEGAGEALPEERRRALLRVLLDGLRAPADVGARTDADGADGHGRHRHEAST